MQRQRRDKETTKRLQLKANNQAPSKAGSASRTPTPKRCVIYFCKRYRMLEFSPPNTVVYPARQNYLELISKKKDILLEAINKFVNFANVYQHTHLLSKKLYDSTSKT